MKEILIVGGPNGAGKTTFIESFLDSGDYVYLGADQIAYELCPEDVASVAAKAGREFIKRIKTHRENGDQLIVESTLSGKSLARHIEKFKDAGYLVRVIFISIPNANVSAERVRIRVSKGGHHVPIEDIERRYLKTHRNFWHLYRNLADDWAVYLNEENGHQMLAYGNSNSYDIIQKPEWREIEWKFQA